MPRSRASSPAGAPDRRRWRRWGRSAGSRISTGCGRGSRLEPGRGTTMAAQRKPFPRLFLARPEPFRLVGERVFLRMPERGDYEEWATLRAASRDFLTPWEPSWPSDALGRAHFRARLARYAEDWRTDQGYNFFVFREDE